MKIFLLSALHLVFLSYVAANTPAKQSSAPEDIQEEQNVSDNEFDLEKINTSPNPVPGVDDESRGTIKAPAPHSKQEQQDRQEEQLDKPEKKSDEQPEREEFDQDLENENFIEEQEQA